MTAEKSVHFEKVVFESKDDIKAHEGASPFLRIWNMFINPMGAICKAALIVVLLIFVSAAGGCGNSENNASDSNTTGKSASKRHVPSDTLVVKGLYMGMPGDDALEACKEMVASSKDLVVVDFRNGIEREKDAATKSKEKKAYEEAVKMAEIDVEQFLKWSNAGGYGYDPKAEEFKAKKNTTEYVNEDLSLPRQKGDIGGTSPLGAAAQLADKYGYQMEWMVLGKKYTSEPQTVGSFVVHASEKSGSRGSKGKGNAKVSISRYAKLDSQIRGYSEGSRTYEEIARPIFAAKGLEPYLKDSRKIWFRLTLNDAKGKPVKKTALTKAFLRLNPTLRIQGKLTSAQEEIAGKFVDSFLQWVEFGNNNAAYFMNKSEPWNMGEKVSSIIGAEINNTRDEAMMMSLAMECHLKVEWGLPARSIKSEEAIETVTIPANGKSMWDAMRLLDSYDDENKLLESRGLGSTGVRCGWMRLVLKTTNGVEVAKADVVKNWLAARGYYPPSDKLKIAKKNLIQISFKKDGVREDKLKGLCFVWIDGKGNVKEVYFNEDGMAKLFNAGDLSSEEFAKSLVSNYSGIPSLEPKVQREDPGRGIIQSTTWIHKNPKGYQVKLFERVYYNNNGVKYNKTMLENDVEVAMALSLVSKLPTRYFTIFAIKPESARKFD